MKFRKLLVALLAVAFLGAVGCGGGEKKDDEMPTEETEQPMEADTEEEPATMESDMAEEPADAPAEEEMMEEAPEGEEGDEEPMEEEGGE